MSLKEAIDRIGKTEEQHQENELAQRRKPENEAARIRKQTYVGELPEALRTQSELLEELRQIGVVAIIEELTGPIPPVDTEVLTPHDGTDESWKKLQAKALEHMESMMKMTSGEWVSRIEAPESDINGHPYHNLRIQVKRIQKEAFRPNMSANQSQPTLAFDVFYTSERRLMIAGNETTFNEPDLKSFSISDYEDALARAILRPRVEWPK